MKRYSKVWSLSVVAYLPLIIAARDTAAAAVSEARAERFDATHIAVIWAGSNAVDVYLTARPEQGLSQAHLLSKKNHDGRYMATTLNDQRSYFLLRDGVDGQIARVSERVLPLEHGSNFRDIGGYPAARGKHIRWGLIYRSGATPLLTEHDLEYIRSLGLSTMIDLRSTEERQLAPSRLVGNSTQYVAIDYPINALPEAYFEMLTALAPQYRAIFDELLSRKGPISYNCTGGQDRTGIATALVLSALGVPRKTILEDYHLSTVYRHPENETPAIDPVKYPGNAAAPLLAEVSQSKPLPLYSADGRSMLAEMFDRLDARWGSVDRYLEKVLNVGPPEVARLRAIYLE